MPPYILLALLVGIIYGLLFYGYHLWLAILFVARANLARFAYLSYGKFQWFSGGAIIGAAIRLKFVPHWLTAYCGGERDEWFMAHYCPLVAGEISAYLRATPLNPPDIEGRFCPSLK